MAGPRVTVLGSLNTDISVPVPHLPGPGETVLAAAAASIGTGGKGANQAVAAARLGAATRMVGCRGDDEFGGRLRDALAAEGIDVAGLRTVPGAASGLALITVDPAGENVIAVAPGANGLASEAEVAAAFSAPCDVLVLSAEIPVPVLEATVLDDRFLRLQADYENYQKRVERERIDHLRHATGSLMARLLPVLDNFDRAIAAAGPPCNDPVLDGIFMIQKQLLDELGLEGLRPMDSLGAPFDPALHEAVATVVDPSVPSHTVTLVFQRGYFLHDRVLRAALVRVSVDGPPGAGARADAQEA